ncbi:pancreatic triacylglycerol lipase-like [Onthophagus taurus]|uniref:pancreatic triacylglycerol lipase-like n=1 Tax=Onthophagus taurus TaxID=166361 RepID=UPI000C207C29|nr:pancreatic triacylglycerol lipase-like [Onthophagus taurus]
MWKVFAFLLLCVCGAYARVSAGDIRYFLWNGRANREELRINQYGNNIDRNAPVKILIHGWTESIDSFWYGGARTAYVGTGANVIAIDWSRHAQLTYPTAVGRLSDIGEFIAQFINGLVNSQGISINDVHLVGHSLGAHLSGFTGKALRNNFRTTLGRISGLDPAGPSFTTSLSRNRLDSSDAARVDTILTDAGLSGLGINRSLGHVNFWPNGGSAVQPGCLYYPCSHNRAPRFFNEGITSRRFVARRCGSYSNYNLGLCRLNPQNLLGEFTDFSTTGDFYLSTRRTSPFAQG